ncbi:MAG: 2-oxo acid dehydrogenase subunit E2 [Polyangiaceae bacterium]
MGAHTIFRPSLDRQLAMDAFAATSNGHPMVALLELDVTDAIGAIERLRSAGQRVSLFAFVLRCIAIALSEHPDLNMLRHGTRLVRFEDVDVNVPVEVRTRAGRFPRQTVIRRAQDRSVAEIYAELAEARARHERSGEFSFTLSTGPRAAIFVVGSVVERPWMHAGQIAGRSVLAVSMMVDHDLVDGAPAARFAKRLQELVESADGLRPSARAAEAATPDGRPS